VSPGRIEIADDAEALAERAATWIAERLADAVDARGRASLALPGGRTPLPIYARLLAEPLRARVPWAALDVYFGDERCVPPDDPSSNYAGAREALLEPAGLDPKQVHRMQAERPDAAAAAADYAALLPERLDVLFLGIGEDGHTASLFPGRPAAAEETARVVVVEDSPKPPPRRLSITSPVIAGAHAVLVVATGAGKADAVARALEGPLAPAEVPVQAARGGTWLLDRAASARLQTKNKKEEER